MESFSESCEFDELETSISERQKRGKKENAGPAFCSMCSGIGFALREGETSIEATPCPCIDEIDQDGDGWVQIKNFQERSDFVNSSQIPNRYIKALNSKNIPVAAVKWLDGYLRGEESHNFFFFYGDVGTGKTHTAAYLLLEILKSGLEKSVLYLPVYEFVERREQYLDFRYSQDRGDKEYALKRYNWIRNQIKLRDVVVLDELGQEKLTTEERKIIFKLLEDRYNNNKPTILISNHCDNKALTLEGKLLKSLVGTRISSRIKSAKEIYFQGADRRAQEGGAIITQAEIEGFTVPAKILTHDENTQQIMTWLTRNPAFEVVSTQRRNQLTYINNRGEVEDKDREGVTIHENVWVVGDVLKIYGPVCDHEDKKLYALLLKELANSHKDGNKGLVLKISLKNILRILDLHESGKNILRVKRQLNRLVRMSFDFKNAKGNRWMGPLINEVYMIGESRDCQMVIEFNHFMITFYRLHAYTTFDRTKSTQLIGDSSAFYLFYSSHSVGEMKVSVETCKKLLAIDPSFDKKEALKRVKAAVCNLIKSGVMHPEKTFVKDGKVHTYLATA